MIARVGSIRLMLNSDRLTVLLVGPLHSVHMRSWAREASSLGFRVLAAGDVPPGVRAAELSGIAEEVFLAPRSGGPGTTPLNVLWLRRLMLRVRPDVVHAHWVLTWGYWAAQAWPRGLVVTPWGTDLYRQTPPSSHRPRLPLRRARRVLVPSPALGREAVRRGADPARVQHVELGVDLERFSPGSAEERDAARRRLGIGDGPTVLSFRGGSPIYNLPLVAEGFARLRRRVPDAQLVVFHGRTALSHEARAALERPELEGHVQLRGFVPEQELPLYFRAATVGISIPSSDGSPVSVWEGFASGLPMVLSDLPQIRERVEGSGAARLVDLEPESITGGLQAVISETDGRERMALAARRWAQENVDPEVCGAQIARAYREAAGKRLVTRSLLPNRRGRRLAG